MSRMGPTALWATASVVLGVVLLAAYAVAPFPRRHREHGGSGVPLRGTARRLVPRRRVLLSRPRGSVVRETGVAAMVSGPPSLALALGLALAARSSWGESLAPAGVLLPTVAMNPQQAALGTIVLVGWFALFAWRVRQPRPDADG